LLVLSLYIVTLSSQLQYQNQYFALSEVFVEFAAMQQELSLKLDLKNEITLLYLLKLQGALDNPQRAIKVVNKSTLK
jgi:hypothetical protein